MKLISAAAILTLSLAGASAFANKGEHFAEMDANSDGQITSAEHEAAANAKFSKADANSDGTLTKGELTTFMMDEKGKSASKAEKKTDKKISKFDSNSDGSLTLAEFTQGMKEMFGKVDADKSGSVSKDEMEKAKH